MIVHVQEEDFAYAREVCPGEAPRWMLQEFAANRALRRAFPDAELIKVDRSRMQVDEERFHRSLLLYMRMRPYRFLLSNSKLYVRIHDVLCLLTRR